MNKPSIFYSWFPEAKCIDTSLSDFYNFCIENCNKDGLALDIGADMCIGLTNSLLENKWNDTVYCFDLWVRRKPDRLDGTMFIEGDALSEVEKFVSQQTKTISIIEVDLRGIEKTRYHPDDLNLDYELSKTEPVLDFCMDYVTDNTVIILSEFHSSKGLNSDAFSLARAFAKHNVNYKCLCYGMGIRFGKSAWIIKDDKTSLHKDDLINMLALLK
jgi:hypothetical protein